MLKDEVLEQVRVNLLRYLEQNKQVDLHMVARRIGYSYGAVQKFASNEVVTVPVASMLVAAYPEVGEGLVCPHCQMLKFGYRPL